MRDDKIKEAKIKAGQYCAYQERTQQEVRNKLYEYGLYSDEVEDVLTDLIIDNYVNEERFAKAFAGGKFRIKNWGRRKIVYALKQKNISSYCIDAGLKEISEEEYQEVLLKLIKKKSSALKGQQLIVNRKIADYLKNKGFEPELVWSMLNAQSKTDF